jgi:hypothetical protein|tara:strand:- start:3484 stop:4926 length:1443 start_codon:yes stop_codon:yes gene_type:complete
MPNQVNTSDVSIDNLEIHSATGTYDLRPHFVELNLYENLYASSLTSNITLIDSVNLPYNLALVGQEVIDINISLSGFDTGVDKEHLISINPPPMHVNTLNNRIYNKPKAQAYTLSMISEHFMSSVHSKVSKSYFDKTIGEIVENIYLEYLDDRTESEKKNDIKGLFVEETERTERIIIPSLTPIEAINWLAKRAVQGDDFGANYLFFETLNGSRFVSLNYLIREQEPVVKFVYKPRVDDSSGVEHLSAGIIKIDKFAFIKQFNRIELIERGVYSSKLITHDIVTKTIEEHDYDGYSQWEEIYHLGKYPPLSDSDIDTKSAGVSRISHAPPGAINFPNDAKRMSGQVDGNIEFYPKHDRLYSQNIGDLYDNEVELWRQRRKSHMGIHDGLNILIETNGVSGLRVGHIVELELPSPETSERDGSSDSIHDKFLSGNYMVTAIQHIFSSIDSNNPKIAYTMKIELSKDGMEEQVAYRKSRKED